MSLVGSGLWDVGASRWMEEHTSWGSSLFEEINRHLESQGQGVSSWSVGPFAYYRVPA